MCSILQLTHGAALCTLAIFQSVRQSLQMYHVTKQWQLNRYMTLLVKQGILYFFVCVPVSSFPPLLPCHPTSRLPTSLTETFCHSVFLFSFLNVLGASGKLPTGGWQLDLLTILQCVPIFTLSPRFILSIRELYARDVQGRRGEAIDTGFGLSSGCGAGGTAIVFADVEQKEGSEAVEEVPREVVTSSSSARGAGGTAIVFTDVERNEGSEDIEEVPREAVMTQSE